MQKWVSNVFGCLSPGAGFAQNGTKEINEEGLAFYDKVFDALLRHGIEPVVTINHFDIPMYLADEYDGWEKS